MEDLRQLSARFKGDFAYPTVKDRIPVILTQVVDRLYRMHAEIKDSHGEVGAEELKDITGRLSKLKNEIQTDKPIVPLTDGLSDVETWAKCIQKDAEIQGGESSWFKSPWLLTECYFYRRIWEAIQLSSTLKGLDQFREQKQNALSSSSAAVQGLSAFLLKTTEKQLERTSPELQTLFNEFLQIALWGNKCDLSISAGSENHQKVDPIAQLTSLKSYILVDNMPQLWSHVTAKLSAKPEGLQIEFVLDNAGFELFTDLCLAEFLLKQGVAKRVRFHGKRMPWFVSDVTEEDFGWTLEQLANHKDNNVAALGKKWQENVHNGLWEYTTHDFWTMPHDFALMKTTSPELYEELSRGDLVIFKGDLNYRKLTGDMTWPTTTEFDPTLRGFHPAPLVTLRTLKCDSVVGLQEGRAKEIEVEDRGWMLTGTWAVIQFSSQIV